MVKPANGQGRPSSLDALLAYAWTAGKFTASDAMGGVGLTRSTTIEATDTLVGLGLLRELPNAREAGDYSKGRPARRFEMRANAGVVVGVDAGHAHLSVTVADLRGSTLGRYDTYPDASREAAADRRRAVADAVEHALVAAGKARDDVISVCVGVPAPVAADGGSPPHPAGFWQRMNPRIAEVFEGWAPLVRVDNDSTLAAAAERRFGEAVGCEDFVALMAGRRFGAGVVSGGQLLRGHNGGVGEMYPLMWLAGVARLNGLGELLALSAKERIASGEIPATHPLARKSEPTAEEVLGYSSDPEVRPVIDEVARVLARVVGLLGNMYDPQRVVLCGAIAGGIEVVVERAREILPAELHLPAPELVASKLGADVVVVGAVAAAVEEAQASILDLVASGRFVAR